MIMLSFLIASMVMISFEDNKTTQWLIDKAPYLVINNADTARSMLSTMIGGLISLMVFSFSMVMMILNQASSNFSPRLLPGLVSDKRNQIVLGAYLGSIVYNIIVLMSVLPEGNKYTLNGFSILIGMVMAISCLGAFIYFIHTISSGIQINNILEGIFNTTKNKLEQLLEEESKDPNIPDINEDDWTYIRSVDAGYYQGVDLKGLLEFCQDKKVNIKVIPHKGEYLLPNVDLFAVDKSIKEEDRSDLRSNFLFSDNRDIAENYSLGIKQITEVGIKAMSPGINDPGTAVMTIDYLTELLALRMQIDQIEVYYSDDNTHSLQLQTESFKSMLYYMLAAYRQYCKHDIILMEKIVLMLKYLLDQKANTQQYYVIIKDQLKVIKEDIDSYISNSTDKKRLSSLIEQCIS